MRRIALVLLLVVLVLGAASWCMGWSALWGSPDQRGAWLFGRGDYNRAADAFADPVWRGVAQMRAGRFADAAQSFSVSDTAIAAYDQGNALIMLGQYQDAVTRYDAALHARPGWPDAAANRALALARAALIVHQQGQETTDTKGRDEVYRQDRDRNQSAPPNEATAPMNDESIRALWLRRVQTRPADFLRARFAYQLELGEKR